MKNIFKCIALAMAMNTLICNASQQDENDNAEQLTGLSILQLSNVVNRMDQLTFQPPTPPKLTTPEENRFAGLLVREARRKQEQEKKQVAAQAKRRDGPTIPSPDLTEKMPPLELPVAAEPHSNALEQNKIRTQLRILHIYQRNQSNGKNNLTTKPRDPSYRPVKGQQGAQSAKKILGRGHPYL